MLTKKIAFLGDKYRKPVAIYLTVFGPVIKGCLSSDQNENKKIKSTVLKFLRDDERLCVITNNKSVNKRKQANV